MREIQCRDFFIVELTLSERSKTCVQMVPPRLAHTAYRLSHADVAYTSTSTECECKVEVCGRADSVSMDWKRGERLRAVEEYGGAGVEEGCARHEPEQVGLESASWSTHF